MALQHSPGIVTNGLIFAYDMNNIEKSFRGAPTTNLVGWDIASHSAGTDSAANLTQITNSAEHTYRGKLTRKMVILGGGYFNFYMYTYNTGVSSTVFTASCKIKFSDGSNPGSFITQGYIYGSAGSFFPSVSFRLIDDGWYQATWTYSGTSMTLNSLTGLNGTVPSGKTFYLADYQVEALSVASNYAGISGTRSNTQALLDQTGRSSITASNMTYNNDNTFDFNYANFSHVRIPLSTAFNKTTGTMNFWLYPTRYNGGNGYFVNRDDDIPNAADWFWIGPYSGFFYFRLGNGSTCCDNDLSFGSVSTVIPLNTWTNMCFTWQSNGTAAIYKNGVLYTSRTIGNVPNTNPASFGRIGLGHDNADDYFHGKMPIVSIYNRVLTAAEILQNFNAIRSRYSI